MSQSRENSVAQGDSCRPYSCTPFLAGWSWITRSSRFVTSHADPVPLHTTPHTHPLAFLEIGFTQGPWAELKWTEEICLGFKKGQALGNSDVKITSGVYPTAVTAHILGNLGTELFTVVLFVSQEMIGNMSCIMNRGMVKLNKTHLHNRMICNYKKTAKSEDDL